MAGDQAHRGGAGAHRGVPLDWRLTARDREAARRARDRMLAWDFDRLVITHGMCMETGAHANLEQAFAWLG